MEIYVAKVYKYIDGHLYPFTISVEANSPHEARKEIEEEFSDYITSGCNIKLYDIWKKEEVERQEREEAERKAKLKAAKRKKDLEAKRIKEAGLITFGDLEDGDIFYYPKYDGFFMRIDDAENAISLQDFMVLWFDDDYVVEKYTGAIAFEHALFVKYKKDLES